VKFTDVMHAIALGLCTLAVQANAQIYKCVDPASGAKTYSDTGCVSRAQRTTIAPLPGPAQSLVRPEQSARLSQGMPAPAASATRESSYTPPADPVRSIAVSGGDPDSYECEQAKRRLAVRKSRVTRFASDATEPMIDVNRACGYFMNPNPAPGQVSRLGTP